MTDTDNNPRNDANCEAVRGITQGKREKQVAVAFDIWLTTNNFVITGKVDIYQQWQGTDEDWIDYTLDVLYNDFTESDEYKSIPPAPTKAKLDNLITGESKIWETIGKVQSEPEQPDMNKSAKNDWDELARKFDMREQPEAKPTVTRDDRFNRLVDFLQNEISLGFLPKVYKERLDWYLDTYFTEAKPQVGIESRPGLCNAIPPGSDLLKAIEKTAADPKPQQPPQAKGVTEGNAILDTHQQRVYHIFECDNEMLNQFPNRYLRVLLSDKLSQPVNEGWIKPTDNQLIEIAILFNSGKIQKTKLADMVAMCQFVLDRLFENGDVTKQSTRELSPPKPKKEGK